MACDDLCWCGAPATQWCHATCCSGETGFCDYHFSGTRHERELHFGQLTGGRLPDDVAGCDAALSDWTARLAAEPVVVVPRAGIGDVRTRTHARLRDDARERRCAELRLIIDLLQRERAALVKNAR